MRPEPSNQRGTCADRRAGFTLLELLVATLSSSILGIAVASVLVYAHMAWEANGDAVRAQQEGTLAIDMLNRSLRRADAATVVVSPGQVSIGPASFFANGGDLVYDPDTGAAGDEMTVIDGWLTAFTVTTLPDGGASIDLQFKQEETETRMNTLVAFRN
jgi:type II secretory pathway pseudopilin PulG